MALDFVKLTDSKTPDHKIYPEFLDASPKTVKRTYADGAYDRERYYKANFTHGASPIISPQRNARYREAAPEHLRERNKSLLEIRGLGDGEDGRRVWKKLKRYHRRSLAEMGMYRFKAIFVVNYATRPNRYEFFSVFQTEKNSIDLMKFRLL